jgi:hypothetical protein
MKRSAPFIVLFVLLLAVSMAVAGNGSGPAADPSQAFEVSGIVVAVTGGSGSGMPVLTVEDAALGTVDVGLAPVWFLQDAGFSVAEGDSVHLIAYPCSTCSVAAVAAWVDNLSNRTSVDLRDEDGRPLWTRRQAQRAGSARPGNGGSGGQGNGTPGGGNGGGSGGNGSGQPGGSGTGTGTGPGEPGGLGSGLDMTLVATVTGEVVDLVGHAGSGQPVLTLDADGEAYAITVSPYQPIVAAGLILEPGIMLTVTFAPTECNEDPHDVAISILDVATGVLVQLRDPETGFPMTGGSQQHRPNWP